MCLQICMLEKLMDLQLHTKNIVKFFGWFNMASQMVLVYEWLDMNLADYCELVSPMPLSHIRTAIQQV